MRELTTALYPNGHGHKLPLKEFIFMPIDKRYSQQQSENFPVAMDGSEQRLMAAVGAKHK